MTKDNNSWTIFFWTIVSINNLKSQCSPLLQKLQKYWSGIVTFLLLFYCPLGTNLVFCIFLIKIPLAKEIYHDNFEPFSISFLLQLFDRGLIQLLKLTLARHSLVPTYWKGKLCHYLQDCACTQFHFIENDLCSQSFFFSPSISLCCTFVSAVSRPISLLLLSVCKWVSCQKINMQGDGCHVSRKLIKQ